MPKILTIFGTRPEAIKLAPVILELNNISDQVEPVICVTAQHRQMLDRILCVFDIVPDLDLDVMKEDQSLPDIMATVILELTRAFEKNQPDIILIRNHSHIHL